MTALGTAPAAANITFTPARSWRFKRTELLSVESGDDEQTIHTEGGRALEVGPNRIADREHASERRHLAAPKDCGLVERSLALD